VGPFPVMFGAGIIAPRFTRVYELCKNRTVRNLDIDVSALYLITAPKTPEPVRKEIITRAQVASSSYDSAILRAGDKIQ
jgi:hypothetical protein